MQVSVEKTSELRRKMTVSIPDAIVQEKMDSRLKSLAREVKVAGFRPGKVPANIVKKLYGDRIKGEITGDLIESTYFEALRQENLNPAGHPQIHPSDENGDGFEYIAEFEVLPEISLDVVNRLQIINPSAEITESDLENMLVKLRIQKRTWQEVERDSQSGDLVTINFSGTSEGENFTNGKAENSKIEIGGRQMIPGFEEALLGLSTGAVKKFSATFPEQYHNTKLAGKAAEFEIEVVKVEEPVLPEINVEFIQSYGVESGDLETFRNEVKANMERELQQTLKTRLKNNVFDNLYEQIALALPKVMIDIEIEKMLQPLAAQAQKEHFNPQDIELPESLEAQAERRVALGLILSEIVKQNQLKIDAQKVRSFITELSKSYETPEEVINWYYADQNRLNEVQQMVLEDQAVDWVLSQAQVTTQSLSFSEVMDKQQIEV